MTRPYDSNTFGWVSSFSFAGIDRLSDYEVLEQFKGLPIIWIITLHIDGRGLFQKHIGVLSFFGTIIEMFTLREEYLFKQ